MIKVILALYGLYLVYIVLASLLKNQLREIQKNLLKHGSLLDECSPTHYLSENIYKNGIFIQIKGNIDPSHSKYSCFCTGFAPSSMLDYDCPNYIWTI